MMSQDAAKRSRRHAGFESARFKSGARPVHPGEILKEDFLEPARLSVQTLANALRVPAPCLDDILLQRCGITAEMAMRLARYFGSDAQSWLGLQMMYDLHVAWHTSAHQIQRDVAPAGWKRPRVIPNRSGCHTSTGEPIEEPLWTEREPAMVLTVRDGRFVVSEG